MSDELGNSVLVVLSHFFIFTYTPSHRQSSTFLILSLEQLELVAVGPVSDLLLPSPIFIQIEAVHFYLNSNAAT